MEGVCPQRLSGDKRNIRPTGRLQTLRDATEKTAPTHGEYDRVDFESGRQSFGNERGVAFPNHRVVEGMKIGNAVIQHRLRMAMGFLPCFPEDDDLSSLISNQRAGSLWGTKRNGNSDGNAELAASWATPATRVPRTCGI